MDAVKDDAKIVEAARKALQAATDADRENREMAEDDLRFVVGDQWPEDVRAARERDAKPCLTINGLPQYLRQVTGQIRDLNPAIVVSPSDHPATEEIADIYAGLIRHIENKCDSASIYEGAAESAAACGIGHFRVRTDYCSHDGFDQEILIERIPNPLAVFWDPASKDPTRADAQFCLIAESMQREDFKEAYPDATLNDITKDHEAESYRYWSHNETVTVAEYFWVEHDEYDIIALPGGVVRADELPDDFPKVDPTTGEKWRKRKVRKPRVMWAKVSHDEVLEGPTEMPCGHIPVFAVTGEEIHVGEAMYRSSVVRFAKDPQMLYNIARSAQAEVVTLQPRAPWLVTAKQVSGFEKYWAQANTANRPYLPYNPDEKAGPPSRVGPPVSSQGLANEIALAVEDMKRTTGIYDASLGARSNETSGVAINARKLESANATSVYADNMVKAITQCGRVIVQMIPKVYDTARTIRILGADDQESAVRINEVMTQMGADGMPQTVTQNDMTAGRYDVRVSVGPAHQTLRQEAASGQLEFMRVFPNAAPVIADIVAGNQEWPQADKIAERLRKVLPPGVAEQEGQQDPQQAQAMQAEMQARQQAMAMQQAEAEAKVKKAMAEAVEAEAQARKALADAARAEAEAAAMGLRVAPPQPQPQQMRPPGVPGMPPMRPPVPPPLMG